MMNLVYRVELKTSDLPPAGHGPKTWSISETESMGKQVHHMMQQKSLLGEALAKKVQSVSRKLAIMNGHPLSIFSRVGLAANLTNQLSYRHV